MTVLLMLPVVIIAAITRCNCEPISEYKYNTGNSAHFGDLLKPPPPPLPIAPVPFHRGKQEPQTHDLGYNYQATHSPPIPPIHPSHDFKFPAPFYKQYNFNFVPPPGPFSTTASPSFFQKVSGWLFPSQQTAAGEHNLNIESLKKDCNPCNLVPWIPVIKYNLGDKNAQQSHSPTYGPPSSTVLAHNVLQYHPHAFNSPQQDQKPKQLLPSHATYGIPDQSHIRANAFENPSSTYRPPSVTQQISISSINPSSSVYSISSSPYGLPISSIHQSGQTGQQSASYVQPITSYGVPTSTYKPTSFVTPVPTSLNNLQTYIPEILQNQSPVETNIGVLNVVTPTGNIQLPKVSHPIGFKNSYGEDISTSNALNIPYSFTSLEAESSKIKTQVVPNNYVKSFEPNISVALAIPAPFAINRGRNIHTLQPVALPNLSVSPLPPIFNARPFRPTTYPTSIIHKINYMKNLSDTINVAQSVPIAEFVHSIEYPIIQSPIIDIDASKSSNQNKEYRNIPNSYVVDEVRDISPQASEDHISATKANQDISFESTGAEVGNNLYNSNIPTDMRHNSYMPSNHKPEFVDLRGVKDEDVDRYRTENNLQSIDSPLLYLKPSAPHKNFGNFLLTLSTPASQKDYDLYDDISTTHTPLQSTPSNREESDVYYKRDLSPSPDGQENHAKIVQIIVPYITEQKQRGNNKELRSGTQETRLLTKNEYLGRKAPSNTEAAYFNTATETSIVPSTTTEHSSTVTEHYSEMMNTPTVLSDLYDVKGPPFDIIKLQHTIDDWTEQEYSNHYATPDRTRSNEKYAKQIPDDFFTTMNPTAQQDHNANDYNYDDFDHEGSSSVQHSVTDTKNNTLTKSIKEYNIIDITENKHLREKGDDDTDDNQKLRIYTAASSFRSTTTTPAPWGSIQTSISPLTKEKVYVVTSKPWRDKTETTEFAYGLDKFESKKTNSNSDYEVAVDDFPFKSPRFSSRPPFGFTASGPVSLDSIKSDSSYGFSKGWHQSINNLRSLYQIDSTLSSEGPDDRI